MRTMLDCSSKTCKGNKSDNSIRKTSWRDLLRLCGSAKPEASDEDEGAEASTTSAPIPFPSVTFHRRQYRLIKPLGSGAFGDVFLARHSPSGYSTSGHSPSGHSPSGHSPSGHSSSVHSLAVKRHRADDGGDFAASQRLARALAGGPLHPLIVRLLGHVTIDAGEAEAACRLTLMEFCSGGDLQLLQPRLRPCDEAELAFVTLEVAEAVGFLHEHSVYHLDVRACNVLLTGGCHCRLADFSITEVRAPGPGTAFSVRLGSRGRWLPPEIVPGRASPAGGFTDWFGLGDLAAVMAGSGGGRLGEGPLSSEFCHFVRRLRQRDPAGRLGSQGGLAEVLGHGFVARRAARLLGLPTASEGGAVGLARLRELVRGQRLRPPERMLRMLRMMGDG